MNEARRQALTGRFSWKEGDEWKHSPLSNFFIESDGTHVEGEYQAYSKTQDPDAREVMLKSPPGVAKKVGRKVPLRPDHEEVKFPVMAYFVSKKFRDHPELAEYLLLTRPARLVEGNDWHDQTWGDCRCGRSECREPGKNWLGLILMTVRANLAGSRYDASDAAGGPPVPNWLEPKINPK